MLREFFYIYSINRCPDYARSKKTPTSAKRHLLQATCCTTEEKYRELVEYASSGHMSRLRLVAEFQGCEDQALSRIHLKYL